MKLRALTWLSVALLSVGLFSYLQGAFAAISSNVELDYGEGTVLWQAQNLHSLSAAVHPLGQYPYILFNYTPVFHCAALLAANFMPSLLAAGRLVSVLSLLGVCVLAFLILSRKPRHWSNLPCGLMAGLLLLHLPNASWSFLFRVDTIGIFFTFLGITLFLHSRRHVWMAYAAFLSFTAAVYSKQTLIAAPFACLLCLSFENPRRALRVVAAFAAVGLSVLAVPAFLTRGEIVRHLFTYNVSPLAWRHGGWLAYDLCRKSAFILLPAVAYVWMRISRLNWSRSPMRARLVTFFQSIQASLREEGTSRTGTLFTIYLATSTLACLSITKIGANVNYMLEPLCACCILAALFVQTQLAPTRTKQGGFSAARFLALSSALLVALTTRFATAGFAGYMHQITANQQAHTYMLHRLEAMRGDVYSEEMTLVLQAHKQVPGEPSSVTFLSAMHLWNERPLVDRIRDDYFSALLVNTSLENREHFSPAVRQAVNAEYELREQAGPYLLYLPRPAAASSDPIDSKENHDQLAYAANSSR